MSENQSIQRFLAQAKEKEKKYDWLDAVEFFKKASDQLLKQKDFLKAGDIEERIGYGLYRAAMQAENQKKFKERMRHAVEAYEKAHGFYKHVGDEQKARMFRCKALTKYLGYWLTSDPSEKRKLLDDCLELEDKALALFFNVGNKLEYGRTVNELSQVFFHRSVLEWNRQILKSIIDRGMEWGQKAVKLLTELGDSYGIAGALLVSRTVYMCDDWGCIFIAEPEKQRQHRLEGAKHMREVIKLSERVGDAYVKGLAYLWLGISMETSSYHQESLECGNETRDNYLQAVAFDYLAYLTYWEAIATEEPEKFRELTEKAMQFYEKAQDHYSIMSFMSPRGGLIGPPAGYAEHYFQLASRETNPKKKLEFLEESEKAGVEALKLADHSDLPAVVGNTLHIASKTLEARARLELDTTKKRSRLEKALEYREKSIEILEKNTPFHYWTLGVMQNYLAGIKAELARIEPNLESKRSLLEEAILVKEKCLNLCYKSVPSHEKIGDMTLFAALHGYQDTYATLLMHLYNQTNRSEYLERAIEILRKAIESAKKLDMISLMAESYWKIAKAQDILGENLEAAENYERASGSYAKAAEKISQLKAFYQDYASYMKAWTQIEKAKNHHAEKRYGQAKEYYEKAANLHKSTERWNYLGPNYLAWAQLEAAEDISRREQTEEAKELFQQAAELFLEAEKSIGAKLKEIEAGDEKEMAGALAKASHKRREYCLGRVVIEEAKILDRQGDHVASSRKYGSAARMFQEIARDEPKQSSKEIQPIIFLCQAWQKMMKAEARASSATYGEAAKLFEEAKDHTLDQRTSLLALANSSFCKALEAGTKFEITGNKEDYSAAKNHMEAAEKFYLKAGFKTASEYAKATYILFDAYLYMSKAETEAEPTKKAQYYQVAEKLLQASAGSYTKAKHPEKKEEVQRFLESIKEKRQLAMSLTKVLHVPTIVATTTSFSTPTPTHEKAVGLERFEHTTIEAYLTASKEITVEDQVEVRLDLANVAKEPGLLVRVDNLVPPSFKVSEPPSQYSMEDGSIGMKGKKLDPLKVETVRLSLQATEPGVVNLSPQVIYVDELGKFRTSKVEPVAITVHPKLALEFGTRAAQDVFEYLVSSFLEDYMRRRLIVQEAGWRSFVQVIKKAKVSSRSVYGSRGSHGSAISELERRGLIETRIFLGERGRGGKIVKARISYEKETVKRLVDQKVVKKE